MLEHLLDVSLPSATAAELPAPPLPSTSLEFEFPHAWGLAGPALGSSGAAGLLV